MVTPFLSNFIGIWIVLSNGIDMTLGSKSCPDDTYYNENNDICQMCSFICPSTPPECERYSACATYYRRILDQLATTKYYDESGKNALPTWAIVIIVVGFLLILSALILIPTIYLLKTKVCTRSPENPQPIDSANPAGASFQQISASNHNDRIERQPLVDDLNHDSVTPAAVDVLPNPPSPILESNHVLPYPILESGQEENSDSQTPVSSTIHTTDGHYRAETETANETVSYVRDYSNARSRHNSDGFQNLRAIR